MKPHRKNIRLPKNAYHHKEQYFITICINERKLLLGEIKNQINTLNPAGLLIERIWIEIISNSKFYSCSDYVVMPNHFHAILTQNEESPELTLSDLIRRFKSKSTVQYINGVKQQGFIPFNKKLWQKSFYDRILRSQFELDAAIEYVRNNHLCWEKDPYHSR